MMNLLFKIVFVLALIWMGVYTVSYGMSQIKHENRLGGVMAIVLAAVSAAASLAVLFLNALE